MKIELHYKDGRVVKDETLMLGAYFVVNEWGLRGRWQRQFQPIERRKGAIILRERRRVKQS